MSLNMVGPYLVRNFVGDPPPPGRITEEVEVISVRGVDYSIIRKKGLRSTPYQLETVVDCGSVYGARATFFEYATSVGAPPAKLVWNGYDYDMEKHRFAITAVQLLSIQRNIFICGALSPGFTFDLRARWSGILVPTE